MFNYENGLLISFFLYCYYIFNLIVTLNSLGEKNLNKVGERHSWLNLKIKLMDSSDLNRSLLNKIGKFLVVAIWQSLFIFLSWINVFIGVSYVIYGRYKDSDAPQAVKDFRWKLKNLDMTFDEIVLEIIKVKGLKIENFDDCKKELIDLLIQRQLI